MRPVECEACHQPQPRDWQAGQRCTHCGGTVRAEQRCAACTRWTPAGRFCRECAAELVPEPWYGAARMLVAAGVDGLSLAARVAALDPAQREAFSSRFAQQRAVVEQLVQAARFAESFLATRGHADALEEALLSELPWRPEHLDSLKTRPKGPFDTPEQLEQLRLEAPRFELQELAAFAQVRRGDARRDVVSHLHGHLRAEDPLAVEALLGAVRAWLLHGTEFVGRWNVKDIEALVPKARAALPRAPEAALAHGAVLRLTKRDLDEALDAADLRPLLREGAAHGEPLVRYGCALLLGDADVLDRLADDALVGPLALRALSRLPGPALARRLRDAEGEEEQASLLRLQQHPLSADAFDAVAALVIEASGELQREAVRTLTRTRWAEVEPGVRAPLERALPDLEVEPQLALSLLHWAAATDDSKHPWRAPAEVEAYALLAARALSSAPRTRTTLDLQHVDELFAVASAGRPLDCVLAWLRDDTSRPFALRRLFHVQGSLDSYSEPKDERGVDLFFKAWDALFTHDGFIADVAEGLRREVSSGPREVLLARAWERFFTHPEQRSALWRATASCRRELEERRDADARASELDGGDPVRRFALYGPLDPLGAPPLIDQLCSAHGDSPALCGLTPHVVAIASTLLRAGEHRHALWAIASWMSQVVNRFRSTPQQPDWRRAALELDEAWAQVQETRAATRPKDPSDNLSGFDEQAQTELRLAREVLEREAEHRRRDEERAAQLAAREDERRREAEARAAEQRQREDDARKKLEDARTAVSVATSAVADAGDGSGLDAEVLVPDQPIKTLRDYVALMKALQGGADVMALFQQYDMTPMTWGPCATAWGTLMSRRLDVAMRFAKLLS